MNVRTVLVTGAGGFIGSNLVDDQLARGRIVKALDINLDQLKQLRFASNCELIVGDIRDAELLAKVMRGTDVVFHLASAHLEVNKPAEYFWEINVDAVKTLLDIVHKQNVKRLVHCSSVGVYGPLKELPANEHTACHPDIPYEQTKLEGENAVQQFTKDHQLSVVILRPAWVFGPRCPRTLRLFRTIKKKRFFLIGRGDNFRHPIYISDMLEAFDLAATAQSVDGETFVMASPEPVRLQQLVRQIAEVQNVQLPPIRLPLTLMRPLCAVVETLFKVIGKEPPLSSRSLKFFTESSAFDIGKAKRLLGYTPRVSLYEGLNKTYRFYVENGLI